MKPRIIISDDPFQPGYRYELTAPEGSFDPEFAPELTPAEMLALGVFGGCYFGDHVPSEFPAAWFDGMSSTNFFGVEASQPLEVWRAKGWIHPEDPRGWFQWYCRYWLGRRLGAEDERQIKRWKAIGRHAGAIRKNCMPGDLTCRRRQRQALLHWAVDSRRI